MLFIQYGVNVHASEHLAHDHQHDETCELYLSAERFASAPIPVSETFLFNEGGFSFHYEELLHLCECDKPLARSRAPPAFIS